MNSSPMTSAFLSTESAGLPLHVQLMLAIVAGSGLVCLALAGIGMLARPGRTQTPAGLPPLPDSFPHMGDQLYTALFMLFLLWQAAWGLLTTPPDEASALTPGGSMSWSTLLQGVFVQIVIYLPMLARYACTHPLQRPQRPWWQYVALPLLGWFVIYASVLLLEASGFPQWLIRLTQCPEHQDLVLLFSRGDGMQRLYIGICAVLIAPIAEECCFRGFLYMTLRRWGGCAAAALASALLFAAIHGSLAQMLPLTLFGLVQCIAYEKARSLWLPIAIHMLFNTTSLIATALLLP